MFALFVKAGRGLARAGRLLWRVLTHPKCYFLFGHAPICVDNEKDNRSEIRCERCDLFFRVFVENLRRPVD